MNSTSKRFWGGIRRRLFAVILIILLLNILLLVVLGSGLFRRFYENSKVRELNETADAVQENIIRATSNHGRNCTKISSSLKTEMW